MHRAIRTKLFFLSVLFLFSGYLHADFEFDANEIKLLSKSRQEIYDNFIKNTFVSRMLLDYSGGLLPDEDRDRLSELSHQAGEKIQTIIARQQEIKKSIEDYHGDDWDSKFGSTNIWQNLANDICRGMVNQIEIRLAEAGCVGEQQKNKIVLEAITQIDRFKQFEGNGYLLLLKAKCFAALADDKTCRQVALDLLETIILEKQEPSVVFQSLLQKAELFDANNLEFSKTVAMLRSRKMPGDIETKLRFSFIERKENTSAFEKLVSDNPQLEEIIGFIILSDLNTKFNSNKLSDTAIEQLPVFDAQIAALIAYNHNPKTYNALLFELSKNIRLKTSIILYVTAIACSDSSPEKSVELLIEASELIENKNKLNLTAEKIAQQAADLAYALNFEQDKNCSLAEKAFENYFKIAKHIENSFIYKQAKIAEACGKHDKSLEILTNLSNSADSFYQKQAKLDLLKMSLAKSSEPENIKKIINQLALLIDECTTIGGEYQPVKLEAIKLYCSLLSESKDEFRAQKMLKVLGDYEISQSPQLYIYKSKAYRVLGKYDLAVSILQENYQSQNALFENQAYETLLETLNSFEKIQTSIENFDNFLDTCNRLADKLKITDDDRFEPIRTELAILGCKNDQNLQQIDQNLQKFPADNPYFIRCKARLEYRRQNFKSAAALWAKIADLLKNTSNSNPNQENFWYQAKYNEILSWSKMADTPKKDVIHTIDVLESSQPQMPDFWKNHFKLLKDNCLPIPK